MTDKKDKMTDKKDVQPSRLLISASGKAANGFYTRGHLYPRAWVHGYEIDRASPNKKCIVHRQADGSWINCESTGCRRQQK